MSFRAYATVSFRAQSRNPEKKSTEAFKQLDFSMRSQGYLVEMTKKQINHSLKKGVSPKDFCEFKKGVLQILTVISSVVEKSRYKKYDTTNNEISPRANAWSK